MEYVNTMDKRRRGDLIQGFAREFERFEGLPRKCMSLWGVFSKEVHDRMRKTYIDMCIGFNEETPKVGNSEASL